MFKKVLDAETVSVKKQIREMIDLKEKERYTEEVLNELLDTAIDNKDGDALGEFLHALTRYDLAKTYGKPPLTPVEVVEDVDELDTPVRDLDINEIVIDMEE